MRRYLIVICSCLVGISVLVWISKPYAQQEMDWREELKLIDEEIERSENLKNKYLAAAARAEDEGLRWQFQQNQKQEAKRAFQRAEEKRQQAAMMQERIDKLNARKTQILQEHPEAYEFKRPS